MSEMPLGVYLFLHIEPSLAQPSAGGGSFCFSAPIVPQSMKTSVTMRCMADGLRVRLPYPALKNNSRKYAKVQGNTRFSGVFILFYRKWFFRKICPISVNSAPRRAPRMPRVFPPSACWHLPVSLQTSAYTPCP